MQLPYLTSLRPRLPLITWSPISSCLPVNSRSSCAYPWLVHPAPAQRNYPNTLQKPPGLLVSHCCLLADDWEVKIPCENKGLWFRNFLKFFKEGFIHFLILTLLAPKKSQLDVMISGHSSDSDSQTEARGSGNPARGLLEEITDKEHRRYKRWKRTPPTR